MTSSQPLASLTLDPIGKRDPGHWALRAGGSSSHLASDDILKVAWMTNRGAMESLNWQERERAEDGW